MHNAIITNMKELDFADTVPVSKNSEILIKKSVSLPIFVNFSDKQIFKIEKALRNILK